MATPIPSTSPAPLTGDLIIDALTTGYRWTLGVDRTIDWSISGGFEGEYWTSPTTVQSYARAMLDTFSYYANVRFNYVGTYSNPMSASQAGSEIDFFPSADRDIFPSNNIWAIGAFPATYFNEYYAGAPGDIALNLNSAANTLSSYAPGSAGWALFLHEIGHALGLKHPFDDGGTGHPTLTQLGLGELDIDWATMMAYKDDYNLNLRAYDPATPMLLDVLALQYLYGPNTSTNATNSAYTLSANNQYSSIWDAAGRDEINAASSDRGWEIYLPDDKVSSLSPQNIGYALPLGEINLSSPQTLYWLIGDIEDAQGSRFADVIYGSVLNNVLYGNGGDDEIIGWDGNDFIDGGDGADTIDGDPGNDTIFGGLGNDSIRGFADNDSIDGGAGDDDLNGGQGSDTVQGGLGADFVRGGQGNDVIYGGDGDDVHVNGNLGDDTVYGGNGADTIFGGQGNDDVRGDAGNDSISGDLGNDTMAGGAGADRFSFRVGAGVDWITDFNSGEGDRVALAFGTRYTIREDHSQAIVDLGNGDYLGFAGLPVARLGDWLVYV